MVTSPGRKPLMDKGEVHRAYYVNIDDDSKFYSTYNIQCTCAMCFCIVEHLYIVVHMSFNVYGSNHCRFTGKNILKISISVLLSKN